MKRFNIRVYGIWINDKQEILVSDERIGDFKFTKFPGGGLEFGEGIKDCLIREWKEELNIDIEVGNHIYTTDFFQLSAFDQTSQIISIYYNVRPIDAKPLIDLRERVFDFHGNGHEEITFRQLPLQQFSAMDVSLPIDKIVATLITK
ncbi:MAG: NUDIX domain-containing protein [Chitinophagaceae bacterium]|nr:NUDIX domain-containing protein [Chitinophagaceae bacterium]